MWLVDAAKAAKQNASGYVSTVQEKASDFVATVQEEAKSVLQAMEYPIMGPVDEPIYEEMEEFNAFKQTFVLEEKTDEVSKILEEQKDIAQLHEKLVPIELAYEEFWIRYFFRRDREIEKVAEGAADKAAVAAVSKESISQEEPPAPITVDVGVIKDIEQFLENGKKLDEFPIQNDTVSRIKSICRLAMQIEDQQDTKRTDDEIRIWKARALKMKNAKIEAENNVAVLQGELNEITAKAGKSDQGIEESSEEVQLHDELAALRSQVDELQLRARSAIENEKRATLEKQTLVAELTALKRESEDELKMARQDASEKLLNLNEQLTSSKAEIATLKEELTILKQSSAEDEVTKLRNISVKPNISQAKEEADDDWNEWE